ncbi:hypothetical protein BZA70DRAFT_267605 [Myxozyma melibiosi]|uniref:Uncharacterized protein n=1 Tax=Myxozyma melibiosi TaxID=54550 RepID=A0ABR1F5G3_9ASCO
MADDNRSINNDWRRRDQQSRSTFTPQQQQQKQQQQQQKQFSSQYTPVRGFNSREVEDFLNREYTAALEQARASEKEEDVKNKTVVFQSDGKGWTNTTPKGSAWTQRGHLTAKGATVLSELRRGVQNLPAE